MTWANLLLKPALPELLLGSLALIVLMVGSFIQKKRQHIVYALSLISIAICSIAQYWVYQHYPAPTYLFSHMFVVDAFSTFIKFTLYGTTALVLIYSRRYMNDRSMLHSEYFVLSLFSLLGMNVMVSATHLLAMYMGLEILALALYALIAFQYKSHRALEAAVKYFVLGALASGFLLYGISMLYGATHTLDLYVMSQHILSKSYEPTLLMLGIVFVLCGLAFKLGVVPFHMWVPDIYHGSPMAITLMISAAPKLATLGFIVRLLTQIFHDTPIDWQWMLVLLSVLSMTIGNIAAIAQTNIKRMLAYSTIAHMGFLLLGFIGNTSLSYSAATFYMVTYVLMALGVFGILLVLSNANRECENLEDIKGLNQRNSWYALLLLLVMFSLAGTPPLLGFYAKFGVISAVVGLHLPGIDFSLTWLAVYAVMMSLIGAFYYLRVVKCVYMDDPLDTLPIHTNCVTVVLLSINVFAILIAGILPNFLIKACQDAILQSGILS